jgi:thiol-disulfide isomerase/thioredoxin
MTRACSTRALSLLLGMVTSAVVAAGSERRPASGTDLLEQPAKPLQLVEWDGGEPGPLPGRVRVVRFWTNTCPYCARSLPALQLLAEEFRQAPVQFLGIYHSKPRGSERAWPEAVEKAKGWGIAFPIAYDHEWRTLDSWWLADREPVPTSPTFVIDPAGKIVHVHPGPEFHPSSDPGHRDCDQAFEALRAAIRTALGRSPR